MARINMSLSDETEKSLRIMMAEQGIKTFDDAIKYLLEIYETADMLTIE